MFISIYFILSLECVVNILSHHTGPSLRLRTPSLVPSGRRAHKGNSVARGGRGGLHRRFLLLRFVFEMSAS